MVPSVIFTSGKIGKELCSIVEDIIGKQKEYCVISNTDDNYDALRLCLEENIAKFYSNGMIIFVDAKGGGCWNLAHEIIKDNQNVFLISGVNLPILLRYFTKRNSLRIDELVPAVLDSTGVELYCKRGLDHVKYA